MILSTVGPLVSFALQLFSQSTHLFLFRCSRCLDPSTAILSTREIHTLKSTGAQPMEYNSIHTHSHLFQFSMHLRVLAWSGGIALFLRALARVFYRPLGCVVQSPPSWNLPIRFAILWLDSHRCPKTDLLQLKANTKKKLTDLDLLDKENLAIKLQKCKFAKKDLTWLGFEIPPN